MELYKNREWLYQKYWVEKLTIEEVRKECKCANLRIQEYLKKFNLTKTFYEAMGFDPKDIIGEKFNRLTVMKLSKVVTRNYPNGKYVNYYYYLCKCDCGNSSIVLRSCLRQDGTKSCGCARRITKGEANFNLIFGNYKRLARKRNLRFALTREEFRFLTKQDCFYCGQPANQRHRNAKYYGAYVYNGLDRVDSNKGYTKENVVPCCKICNMAKGTRPLNDFKIWVKKVNKYLNEGGN